MAIEGGSWLFLIVLVLLVHQTWSIQQQCAPSSCGNIHNISYPFSLRDNDPENCSDSRYKLSCENNQTVLYLYDGKYNVREINYNNYIIRVSDSGIQEHNNYSFIPHYFLREENFSQGDPYAIEVPYGEGSIGTLSDPAVFVKCEKPVNSSFYVNISACFNSSLSYYSKRYRYVLVGPTTLEYLEESCQVEQMSLTMGSPSYPANISCTDNDILFNLDLSWHQVYCGSCAGRHDICYLNATNNNVLCYNGKGEFLGILYQGFRHAVNWVFVDFGFIEIILIIGFCHATIVVLVAPSLIAYLIYKWRRRHLSMYDSVEEFLHSQNNLMPIRYSYSEIKKITKSFKDKLGEGGFSTVFKGTLRSGCVVAIKKLDNKPKANGQDFINEVATIGRIHHVNVVQLIGYCVEGSKRALVYEFMPNGSLNNYIFLQEGNILLSYERMYGIALGVAHGIQYLHQGCDMQILHFDIKPHNILLDENFTPKVSDFGLAKLYRVDQSIVSLAAARGTKGYIALEFFYRNIGGISYKDDVYSFGMLLMEMAGRRKNVKASADHFKPNLLPYLGL